MSIFGSKNQPPETSTPTARPRPSERVGAGAEARRQPTHIAAGSKVQGEITGDVSVHVDGEFHGLVRLDSSVVVGEKGLLKGDVDARSVQIKGEVEGNVRGSERVEVMATGSLKGDISAARVVIAEGAFFKGNVEMTGGGSKKAQGGKAPSGGGGGSAPKGGGSQST
ncbi:MAG: polymer-forming cytoskeletal protein, partial [Acidobacteriota bacterium]